MQSSMQRRTTLIFLQNIQGTMDGSPSSVESWVLMSLIYRDLDDKDYENALLLSERLYAIDNNNAHYKHLYASCLYHCLDYTASYTILKTIKSVPCLNLFAKSCLELGNIEKDSKERKRQLYEEGVHALLLALDMNELPKKTFWGDELASITSRHHMPSRSSICNLLGDLYVKLDNIRAASIYYLNCLEHNPYKISAYTKLCDIAPDYADFNKEKPPKDIFAGFNQDNIDLSRSSQPYLPALPSVDISDISFSDAIPREQIVKNKSSMPSIKDSSHEILQQLRSLVKYSPKILEENNILLQNEYTRGEIENKKTELSDRISNDIKQMKATEAFKNKHGLHKKPPTQAPQKLRVDLIQDENDDLSSESYESIYESIKTNTPPRISIKRDEPDNSNLPYLSKRHKAASNKGSKPKSVSLKGFFIPNSNTQYNLQESSEHILEGMNKVLKVLCIIASGYLYQSFYHCEKAALELQKLDDSQYNSARVLCILGKAYYDAGDHNSACTIYRQAFVIAPWYCDGVPFYSTCLWYTSQSRELNVLAFKMKDNKSHLYEAYIAAGNWAKYAKGSIEATKWFEKAVSIDPSRSYGHALLGYEESERNNNLGAKQHFSKSMITNKRSYIGWFGMANAYISMDEHVQARVLLEEAVRLHPRHPVLLTAMAEELFALEEYELAHEYIERSLSIKKYETAEKVKAKIEEALNMMITEESNMNVDDQSDV